MKTNYPHLLSPYTIRNFVYKNRMILAPMWCAADNTDGSLAADNIAFYTQIARGGCASIVTGDNPVNYEDAGYGGIRRCHFYTKDLHEYLRLEKSMNLYVEAVHQYGALAFIEFTHMGMYALDNIQEAPMPFVYGPCAGTRYFDDREIRALDEEKMLSICEDFAHCAEVAKKMGLDGVLIHGGHGVLMGQFLSRLVNKRTDKYGGSLENRARFPLMILQAIRDRVGDDMLIELRISGEEFIEGGITREETVEFAKMIDGLVDIIQLSAGIHHIAKYNIHTIPTYFKKPGCNVETAAAVKAVVKKSAVATIGGINDPDMAEEIIASGKADFVSMARQLTRADPYFPRKLMQGHPERINNCLRCQSCGMACSVNPLAPADYEKLRIEKTNDPKKVVVVGGGPGGMKAAQVAADRGHHVILMEKADRLGGTLRFSDTDEDKVDIRKFKNNLAKDLSMRNNVEIRLNVEATPEMVEAEHADAVIVALGAVPKKAAIPGADRANVLTPMDVYDHPEKVGQRVVFVGGGLTGCETAVHLAHMGKTVTVIGRNAYLAPELGKGNMSDFIKKRMNPAAALEDQFERYHIGEHTSCTCTEITEDGVKARNADGTEVFEPADTVIVAIGYTARHEQAEAFMGTAPLYYNVGDSKRAGMIKDAVGSAYTAAMDID